MNRELRWYNKGIGREKLPAAGDSFRRGPVSRAPSLDRAEMGEQLVANNEFDPNATDHHQGGAATRGIKAGMRFTYPSGAQPLEGFTIKRGLGMGGFGEVYFAISDAGKEVAIKRIQRNLDVELRGARQCLNLKHINLISLWDIRTNDLGESWVVMEYVPGFNLREKLEQHPHGMPEDEIKQWFLAMASGVNYLHRQGIVHRDLKPGNIFFDIDQQIVKIGDYGLSKFISTSKRSGQTESVGTFHYMAPEIGKGIYGKEIDVYALGVILYEMLCGQLPFDGESAHEIIMKHLTADVDLRPIPPHYHEAIAGALRKDPAERFSSVGELLAKLPWPECQGPLMAQFQPPVSTKVDPRSAVPATGHSTTVNARQGHSTKTVLYIGDDRVEEISIVAAPSNQTTVAGRNLLQEGIIISGGGKAPSRPEPIAAAVRGGWDGAVRWWHRSDISVPFKVGLAIVCSIVLILNSAWLIPLALTIGLIYLGYYLVRSWLLPDHADDLQATQTRSSLSDARLQHFLRLRSGESWLIELTTSLLVAAFASFVFSFIGLAFKGTIWGLTYDTGAVYFWLAATTTLGSWAILIIGKSWELRSVDFWMRLVTLMLAGFALGLVSFGIASAFFLDHLESELVVGAHQTPTTSLLISMLMFFTIWFGLSLLNLWVHPTRSTRISIWRFVLGMTIGALLAGACRLSPPLFATAALIIHVTSQLAAPLLSIDESNAGIAVLHSRTANG